jgi:hypothetical protein
MRDGIDRIVAGVKMKVCFQHVFYLKTGRRSRFPASR